MEANSFEIVRSALIGIGVVLFFFLLVFKLCSIYVNFSTELQRLNCEINRTYGAERKHWLRKRRRLFLSLIPFVKYYR